MNLPNETFPVLHYQPTAEMPMEPRNGDRFVLSPPLAADTCETADQQRALRAQVRALLNHLAGWLDTQKEHVGEAYVTGEPRRLQFTVVMNRMKFNPVLEDALSDLDMDVAQADEFSLLRLSVQALPKMHRDQLTAFIPLPPE